MIARSSLAADLTGVASWWAYVARYEDRETWRAMDARKAVTTH